MTKEKTAELLIILVSVAIILASFYVVNWFGLVYLVVFCIALYLASLYILFKLYLRIQHNTDKAREKIDSQKQALEETVGFLENLILHLERGADKNDLNFKEINNTLEKLKYSFAKDAEALIGKTAESNRFNKLRQEQLMVLINQLLELQKDQTNFLKQEIGKTYDRQEQ